MIRQITVTTRGAGLREITREIQAIVAEAGQQEGLCTVFVQHTSASLIIQENADPSARRDLESWLNRLVREMTRCTRTLPRGRTTCHRTSRPR